LRDLSRPLRRKSHYPTLVAMQNSLPEADHDDGRDGRVDRLPGAASLNEIRDHARRERLNRN